MLDKIRQVGYNWRQPWFDHCASGLPQNINGRLYKGINSVALSLLVDRNRYETPVFLTFVQASMEHVSILKGETPSQVIYWTNDVFHKDTGERIPYEVYKGMEAAQQTNYHVENSCRAHYVYNIQQTDYPDIHPELWERMKEKFTIKPLKDGQEMYTYPRLDALIREQKWLCPIHLEYGSRPTFTYGEEDSISMPLKGQFDTGESFYSTLLHEMAHSTGVSGVLDRDIHVPYGSDGCAREELVAELVSALCCKELGIYASVREENAMYIKNWKSNIQDHPEYLYSVLEDVGKASMVIAERIGAMEKHLTRDEMFLTAAMEGDREKLQKLKEGNYFPSLQEMARCSSHMTRSASEVLKAVYDIDITPGRSGAGERGLLRPDRGAWEGLGI